MISSTVVGVGGGQLGRARVAANSAGLTELTRLSVVCADSTVTMSSCHGLREVELAVRVGVGLGQHPVDPAGPADEGGAARLAASPRTAEARGRHARSLRR